MAKKKPATTGKPGKRSNTLQTEAVTPMSANLEIPGDPAKPWHKCKSYKIENVQTDGASCQLDFSAVDEEGKQHGFSASLPGDQPALVRDLFRVAVRWPKCDFEFQSDVNPGGQVGTVAAFR
jgi:hypothetical protein